MLSGYGQNRYITVLEVPFLENNGSLKTGPLAIKLLPYQRRQKVRAKTFSTCTQIQLFAAAAAIGSGYESSTLLAIIIASTCSSRLFNRQVLLHESWSILKKDKAGVGALTDDSCTAGAVGQSELWERIQRE